LKKFEIPEYYLGKNIAKIKEWRRVNDKLKRDLSPTILDFDNVKIYLARHFGFCYGVENAVEIAYKAISENAGKRVFLLSEIIHNPEVNANLQSLGLKFIMDTKGKQLIPWVDINKDDIVIVPAFGTTLELQAKITQKGIDPYHYDTTCPFVEKVWKRAGQIASQKYTIVIHGKPNHEETRATFSHSKASGPSLIINDMEEAILLSKYINGEKKPELFYEDFANRYSENFDVKKDLEQIGVVNQTTMLAADTQSIADFLKNTLINKYKLNSSNLHLHFADTRDTLCYATNDNQSATIEMLKTTDADLAIVVGGYNSSNTAHLVELCEDKLPTFFIENDKNLLSYSKLAHFDLHQKNEVVSGGYLPNKKPANILVTCGASCPDSVLEKVILKLVGFYDADVNFEKIVNRVVSN
jgi:4-hydroxy-3-methylbut-2-en-1-yl diphosphate reductase